MINNCSMPLRVIAVFMVLVVITACGSATSNSSDLLATTTDADTVTSDDANLSRNTVMETELLALINQEREDDGKPALERDDALDEIMLWYGTDMVVYQHIGHEDRLGRRAQERANAYLDPDTNFRCSEITAWWSGASANSHYEAYRASEGHHNAYMENGIFNLGPTTHVGIVVLAGTGPADSSFENSSGTYSGLMFCDQVSDLAVAPFDGGA